MSKISLSPDANGTGVFTIASPNSNTNRTLTLPDNAGTIQTQLDNGFSFRNRIINGDMRIDQRNAGASVTPTNGEYCPDRWRAELTQASKYSVQQVSDAPEGFAKSLLVTSLSAYSVTSTDQFNVRQAIEGFNIADLMYGTVNAKTVTVSFWVKSSLTGTFGASLANVSNTRVYNFNYTISSANTWEYKTATIDGPTSGSWNTVNSAGIFLRFNLGLGSTYGSTTVGEWVSGVDLVGNPSTTSVVGTSGATLNITGVQLEVGSVATPFERRPYGTELSLCQRYYQTLAAEGITFNRMAAGYPTTALGASNFQVPMRATPSVTNSSMSGKNFYGLATDTNLATGAISISVNFGSPSGMLFYGNAATSLGGTAATPMVVNSAGATVNLSAEL